MKQVIHIYVPSGIREDTNFIDTDGLLYIVNPFDEVAVEAAIRIKETLGGGDVTLITLGPSRAERALRWCMGIGADKGIHIVARAFQDLDPWVTSVILAEVIGNLEPDLILFGKHAIDDRMGQVGPFVAEILNLPIVTSVAKLDLSSTRENVIVQKALERGNKAIVSCPLPAVLTVEKSLNKPRYPTFPARKNASKRPIQRIEVGSVDLLEGKHLEAPLLKLVNLSPPKIRPKRMPAPDSNLSGAERVRWIMTGGLTERKGGLLDGKVEKIAPVIVELLKEIDFVSK